MKYRVYYIEDSGKKINKIIKTDLSHEEIIKSLKQEGYTVLDVTRTTDSEIQFSKKKISDKKLCIFLTEFSILLNSGIGLKQSLLILENQEKDKYMKEILKKITNDIEHGRTLSASLERTGFFPSIIPSVINAGEISSNLPETLKIMSDFYENEIKLKDSFRNALYYPALLVLVTIFVVFVVIKFVMPSYMSLFDSFGYDSLPRMTRNLIRINSFLNENILYLFFISSLVYLLIKNSIRLENTRTWLSKLILKTPLLGKYLINLEIQRLSAIMLLLNKSGIDILENIRISSSTISNSFIKSKLLELDNYIEEGNTINYSFRKLGIFPEMFLNLLSIGEESSSFNEALEVAYNYYNNINLSSNKKMSSLFEPLVIIFVSLIVGAVVVSIALPMFSIINII